MINMTKELSAMRGTMDSIQTTAVKSFEMIKEITYMDGIENIRSAHSVFFSSSKLSIEKRIVQFENHSFELRFIIFNGIHIKQIFTESNISST